MQRKGFILDILEQMKDQDYALLKMEVARIDDISPHSDIDIYYPSKDLSFVEHIVSDHPNVMKYRVRRKSFMTTFFVYFQDFSFISLDFIHHFKRKHTEILTQRNKILQVAYSDEGYKKAALHWDFEYIFLFYLLNGAEIPERYLDYLNRSSELEQRKVLGHLNSKYDTTFNSVEDLRSTKKLREKVYELIKDDRRNRGLSGLRHKINYVIDTLFNNKKGVTITFSGVDGAGKTTILEHMKTMLKKKYREPFIVLRHRPSILPILSAYKYGKAEAEKRTTEKLPRQGGNTSVLSSLVRFAYYFTDYIFGQIVIYYKYNFRGITVLYDRYYFDFINDAKRSNINLSSKLVKPLYRFIYKPDLNMYLYAEPEVILARKQELEEADIRELNGKYIPLFDKYEKRYKNSKYKKIENLDLEDTLRQVEALYHTVI